MIRLLRDTFPPMEQYQGCRSRETTRPACTCPAFRCRACGAFGCNRVVAGACAGQAFVRWICLACRRVGSVERG